MPKMKTSRAAAKRFKSNRNRKVKKKIKLTRDIS
mgnify:CR=1 FL=1